jgi:hypothetical protein
MSARSVNKSRLWKALKPFIIGYVLTGVCVVTWARFHDDTWVSGVIMLAFSLPVTVVYFAGVCAVRNYRLGQLSYPGMLIAGALSAVYPAFFGFFPIYFVRPKFAIPLLVFQFGLVLLVSRATTRAKRAEPGENKMPVRQSRVKVGGADEDRDRG